jgi:uncharacterized membrane protein YdbT with pleckstrin-like domain
MLTTEIVVTDRRLIGKTGFIRRQSIGTMLDKVSSINFDQEFFVKIFGYKTITVVTAGEIVFI